MIIRLDGERPLSWNRFYAGMHWSERQAQIGVARILVLNALPVEALMFERPVDIIITAYFNSRPQDPDNICSKLYIDALVGRLIEDDTPTHVASVTTRSRIDKEKPRVEIEVRERV